MDAVEMGRQRAAELHRRAVARGIDAWLPLEFAVAEASRRGIEAQAVLPGATLLNKGRAVFIPGDQLILYEAAGSPFDRAFLIAHELGHAELGDDPGAGQALHIDPTRTSEPSPVGIDRVVDYGRRQRREIQMDLFAREFLLPRIVVSKLHIENGLSASDIANRLGAPFDVVAQQLFDALLLPAIVQDTQSAQPARPLNELQRDAAAHRGVPYLLEAGPGTGKTQTLIARVEGLLDEGIDPRRILLLTFSNKAAGEMAERIALTRKDASAAMWVGTFHAFGLDIIRRFYDELKLPPDARMLDRTDAAEMIEEEFPRLPLVHYRNLYDPTQVIADILAAISRAKDEVVDATQYLFLANEMERNAKSSEESIAAAKAIEVAVVYQAYEQLKRQARSVDFGDLVSLPVRLLETNTAVRDHLRGLYDHVLVDEYQDVNRSSVRLLEALRPDGQNLWVVGDTKQSIYRFRGASSFNLARFGKEDFPGGARGRLRLNYRSVDPVVNAFSSFAVGMTAGDADSALQADRGPSGSLPELLTAGGSPEQTVAMADSIEAMIAAGFPYRSQAVLCTGNDRLAQLGQDLERLGVPVLFLGSLFERTEVKDLLSFLSVLVDRRAMGLVRLACWPEFGASLADVGAVLGHLRPSEAPPLEWLNDAAVIPSISHKGIAALEALRVALAGFDEASSPWQVLAELLLDRTRIGARIASATSVTQRSQGIAIWQLLNFLRVQPSGKGLPIVRLLDRIRRLLQLSDERDLRQLPAAAQGIDAVRLMTIHGSKGLEFSVVHLSGMNVNTLPRPSVAPACPAPEGLIQGASGDATSLFRAAHAEEQECLFYVALSRARDRLFLYAATQNAKGHRRGLSPFLDRLGSALIKRHVLPTRALPVSPEDAAVDLVLTGGLSFSEQQIALYESCPRRFFYAHVIQIGGRRKTTAFMKMHEAVRTVFRGILDAGGSFSDDADLLQHVHESIAAQGLADHGYVEHYRALAVEMIRYFLSTREGHQPEAPTALRLSFGAEQIIVLPDEVFVRADGSRTLRRVQTGHRRVSQGKDVAAAAFVLAARQVFPSATVELVHLSDRETRQVDMSAKELQGRSEKLSGFLSDIRSGRFPAEPSSHTCPKCPAFFVCGPVPPGPLPTTFWTSLPRSSRTD